MILAILRIHLFLLGLAFLNDIREGANATVTIVDHRLQLHSQVRLVRQIFILLLHAHRNRYQLLLRLHLILLHGLNPSLVHLLAHLRL